jgi:hypothetical protein
MASLSRHLPCIFSPCWPVLQLFYLVLRNNQLSAVLTWRRMDALR